MKIYDLISTIRKHDVLNIFFDIYMSSYID